MTIQINGMAHVILTMSQLDAARAFYGKLLPEFGMKPVFDGDKFFYCIGARNRDRDRTVRPGAGWRALRSTARWPASPLPASPFG